MYRTKKRVFKNELRTVNVKNEIFEDRIRSSNLEQSKRLKDECIFKVIMGIGVNRVKTEAIKRPKV